MVSCQTFQPTFKCSNEHLNSLGISLGPNVYDTLVEKYSQ